MTELNVPNILRSRQWRQAKEISEENPVIDFLDEPTYDEYGVATIGMWGGYLIQIQPMLYTDRLVLTPQKSPLVYDYGWDFPKGPTVMLAALAWNPDTDGEPHGFTKRIGPPRPAGEEAKA